MSKSLVASITSAIGKNSLVKTEFWQISIFLNQFLEILSIEDFLNFRVYFNQDFIRRRKWLRLRPCPQPHRFFLLLLGKIWAFWNQSFPRKWSSSHFSIISILSIYDHVEGSQLLKKVSYECFFFLKASVSANCRFCTSCTIFMSDVTPQTLFILQRSIYY